MPVCIVSRYGLAYRVFRLYLIALIRSWRCPEHGEGRTTKVSIRQITEKTLDWRIGTAIALILASC